MVHMAKAGEQLTPMMRQYLEIKNQYHDAILFFRLGDFYEMFFEDAERASSILDIALTSRNKNQESSVPLCGIPYHSAGQYIRRLVQEGHKVAICEQVEDPKQAKGIVKREVIRVVTPGLLVEDESLNAAEPNYLAAILGAESTIETESYHLAVVDISTGEVMAGLFENETALMQFLLKHPIKEILVLDEKSAPLLEKLKSHLPSLLLSRFNEQIDLNTFNEENFGKTLYESYDALESQQGQKLLRALLAYVHSTQKTTLRHFGEIHFIQERQYLGLDERTFRHLELTKNMRGSSRSSTLLSVLNKTGTAMGSRRLAKWIHYPLIDKTMIEARLDAVSELVGALDHRVSLQEGLKPIHDLERMLGKLALGTVNARDLRQLSLSLMTAHGLAATLGSKFQSQLIKDQWAIYPDMTVLFERLHRELVEEPPVTVREGGIIANKVHTELDELRSISRDGKSFIASLETKERERTGISNLKIRYNRVFGYYIEVTHSHKEKVPDDYIRKQTLSNAERFITPTLKEYENKVLGAEERIKNLEYEIFCGLREAAAAQLEPLRRAAEVLGTLDVLASLAQVSREQRYCRPELCEESMLALEDSRHPVLEATLKGDKFIPNDIHMDPVNQRLILITGPNMAGKSTVMRQAAIAVVMAQMGCYVPAKRAKIGLVDQLFTRIGASDDLTQGQSTFMVEMLETAHILKLATANSFIVLDEIGRGTSTYDGMSIAWAVAEHVAQQIKCRGLFATHYHELTDLSDTVSGVANFQVAVKEWNDQILFLRKLIPGGASRSYGIEVARLAGLPDSLLDRAREVIARLEQAEGQALGKLSSQSAPRPQMKLFQPNSAIDTEILAQLQQIQPEKLSPLDALQFLFHIKEKLAKTES